MALAIVNQLAFTGTDIQSNPIILATDSVSENTLVQAFVEVGTASSPLDGTGGNFTITVTIGSNSGETKTQSIAAGATRAVLWSDPFPLLSGNAVKIQINSPNGADNSVDGVAYLMNVGANVWVDAETYAVPEDNTKGTVMDALQAVLVEVRGRSVRSGNSWTKYKLNGNTYVTFVLDDGEAPSSRMPST